MVAFGTFTAGLLAMLKIKSAQLDEAEAAVDKLVETNKHNREVRDVEEKIQKAKDDVNTASDSDIDKLMLKYKRDRKDGN